MSAPRPSRRATGLALVAILAAAAALAADPSAAPAPRRVDDDAARAGFTPHAWQQQRVLESEFVARLDAARIGRTHQALTREPHRAGTEGSRRVALWIRSQVVAAGFKAVVTPYLFYNSHPGPSRIEMTAPARRALTLVEDRIAADPYTARAADHPAFCAYSGSGTAEGEVVYAGQGTWEDFRALESRGVDLEGKVVLMRYFGAGEGAKVLRAQERGAVAAVLYADPREDGYVQGPVYPDGNWRPPGSIMRRTLADTPYEGDPLSPGWAAKPGTKRLDPARVVGLPKIPVLPISYRDAAFVLAHVDGPVAPAPMQGALRRGGGVPKEGDGAEPLEYHLGPGPARLRLSVSMTRRTDTIRNVVVTIPGKEEPDAWVLLGNHHDAWIYGAGDPSSGTAALLEVVRALGRLKAIGWQPRRTLIVAFWDAEEMNLGGSTEWAEDHAEDLRRKAVAIVNMDSAVFNGGRPLYVAATPSLHPLFLETAEDVPAPEGSGTLAETWLRLQNEARQLGSVDAFSADYDASKPLSAPYIDPVPLGDDQTAFVEHLGLPASDMYYGADYGMYHSLYENRRWMTTIVDPRFRHHRVMAEYIGRLGLRLAMAPIVPLDARRGAAAWAQAFEDLEARAAALEVPGKTFKPVARALDRYRASAKSFVETRDAALRDAAWTSRSSLRLLVAINREIAEAERSFFSDHGLPGHPWYRGLWVAPPRVPGLTESRLPGLRWPLETDQGGTLLAQIAVYAEALDEATSHLHRAEGILAALTDAMERASRNVPDAAGR